MAFSSATVTIGHSTAKSDYDRLLDNTQNNRSRLITVQSGTATFQGIKTFSSGTVFNATATFNSPSVFNSSSVFNAGINNGGTVLATKVIEIGDWNMDATVSVAIAHGLTLANIRAVTAMIRDDANTLYYMLSLGGAVAPVVLDGHILYANSTTVTLLRGIGGEFDSADFNATSFNRGWITIVYEV